MANETKNRQHAIGTFVGAEPVAAPFTSRIVNAVGVDSFTRNSAGNYTAALRDAIAFAGATVRADLPANFLGIVGAQLAPDGASVLVTVFDLSGAPADAPLVALEVVSVVQGEGDDGPAPPLPGPPAPAAGGLLLGWARVETNGALLGQSIPNVLASAAVGAPGEFVYTLAAGVPTVRVIVLEVDSTGVATAGATGSDATTLTGHTGGLNLRHYALFYR